MSGNNSAIETVITMPNKSHYNMRKYELNHIFYIFLTSSRCTPVHQRIFLALAAAYRYTLAAI